MTRCSVIMVTYNSQRTIEPAIDALRRAHDEGIARAIFVDNDSSDATPDILRRHEDWATIIHAGANLGFGRGCNLGAARSYTPYLLFLNPDARMESADIAGLCDFMDEHPDAGIAGPAIIEEDGSLQHAGGLPTPGTILRQALGRPTHHRPIVPGDAPFETDWICGAALMIRRDLFEELGGFDPRFFLYFEETDLCLRTRRRGAEIWAVGTAVARHAAGASSQDESDRHYAGCLAEHYFQSRYYYLRKHHGLLAAAATEVLEMGILAARSLLGHGARTLLSRRLRGPVLSMPRRITP